MKTLRKIVALILSLTMMFALCSCGKKSEEAKDDAAGSLKESALEQVLKKDASVEGTWNGSYNLGEVMGQAFDSEEFEGMDPSQYFDFEGLELPFILELNSDKTFSLQFDVDGFLSIVDDYIGVLAEGFSSFMYDMLESELEAEGMSVDDFLALMEYESLDDFIGDMMGMSLEDYMASLMDESFSSLTDEEGQEEFNSSGKWEFKNDVLTLKDDTGDTVECTYDKTADTITVTVDGDEATEASEGAVDFENITIVFERA